MLTNDGVDLGEDCGLEHLHQVINPSDGNGIGSMGGQNIGDMVAINKFAVDQPGSLKLTAQEVNVLVFLSLEPVPVDAAGAHLRAELGVHDGEAGTGGVGISEPKYKTVVTIFSFKIKVYFTMMGERLPWLRREIEVTSMGSILTLNRPQAMSLMRGNSL